MKLRFRGDLSDARLVMGDSYERISELVPYDAKWTGLVAERPLPWYFHLHDGEALHSFGVKTGPAVFCTFYCDEGGITLWLDVRCGGRAAARLTEPLEACRVVCRKGGVGEDPYLAAAAFCRMMCEKPNLPKEPIFGVNNWYWAYGNITNEIVRRETAYLKEMTVDAVCRPHMIIDDGWQVAHRAGYNGGPWNATNEGFPALCEVAAEIREAGARPGIWFRPLLDTKGPEGAKSPASTHPDGFQLDPSHPYTLEKVATDVAFLRDAGFELIKYDFTIHDSVRRQIGNNDFGAFYDNTKPTCYIMRNLYRTIEAASGSANVLGCNAYSHLVAGLHAAQRGGDDTSGRNFEQTRLCGVGCMTRMAQNNTFFAYDPDCAAFTDMVAHDINLDFLEMAAITGAVTLASVTPGCLTAEEMARIRRIYRIASMGGLAARSERYVGDNMPSHFITPDGTRFTYDWYSYYDGRRNGWTWRS